MDLLRFGTCFLCLPLPAVCTPLHPSACRRTRWVRILGGYEMAKVKLTDRFVAGVKAGSARADYFDAVTKGLGHGHFGPWPPRSGRYFCCASLGCTTILTMSAVGRTIV
jgi:hypothetical protein